MASTILVILGLAWEGWFQGRHLATFSDKNLHDVEFKHPYIPSMNTVSLILATTFQQYAMSLIVQGGTMFGYDPRAWIFYGGIFLISMTVGILAELHWRGVAEMFFSYSTATMAASLFVLMRSMEIQYSFIAFALSVLFGVSVVFLILLYTRGRNRGIPMVFVTTLFLWFIIRFFIL